MENLWKINFEPMSINTPKEIVETQCEYLGELTDGKIIAKISDYEGPISSYTKLNFLTIFGSSFKDQKVNIQEDLGDIGKSTFTFEFFITSPKTPNYKYRIMFFQYGIAFFPTVIVLDEAIANELEGEQDIICYSQEEFENNLKNILNSQKIENVVNALLAIAQSGKPVSS